MGSFLMLLAVLMKWAGILKMQLFQINQNEESSKITINAHTISCQSHKQRSITSAAHYNRIYSTLSPGSVTLADSYFRCGIPEHLQGIECILSDQWNWVAPCTEALLLLIIDREHLVLGSRNEAAVKITPGFVIATEGGIGRRAHGGCRNTILSRY